MPRSNEQERRETWKRPYDDEYNTDFDRGKVFVECWLKANDY